MTAPCGHGSADPRMCPDCRTERLTGRPVPPLKAVAGDLADERARLLAEDDVDYTEVLKADMRHILDRISWACLPAEDLRALLRSALYGVPPHTDVIIRASEALDEQPPLYVISANAVPPNEPASDHGGNSTPLKKPPAGGRPGGHRDPDPP